MLLDNAKAHHARDLKLPTNVALAWRCFNDVLALQDVLVPIIEGLDPTTLGLLTAYLFIINAIHALAIS